MDPPSLRALASADRDAALAVINTSARWHRDFLPAEDVHDPEMTAEQWEAEARRLGALLREHLESQVRGVSRSPDSEAVLRAYYTVPEDRLRSSVTYEKGL